MAMPDAVKALLGLSEAHSNNLSQRVYNVTSFSPTALEISELVLRSFPEAIIRFRPDLKRQTIVDSWPADLDVTAAKNDWGWKPQFDIEEAFESYLIPNIRQMYQV